MPTVSEFQELYNNCITEWTTQNGVNGRRFTSRTNGSSIYFPAAGVRSGVSLYSRGSNGSRWSSSRYTAAIGYNMTFYATAVLPANYNSRFSGFSVRAVQ
jgi:hypothetical protein